MKAHIPGSGFRTLLSGPASVAWLFGIFLSACSSYGPAPPILVPDPSAPKGGPSKASQTMEILHVIPTKLPKDMEDIGTFYKNDGSYSQMVTENPLGPVLDAILIRDLNAGGIRAVLVQGPIPPDASTLQMNILEFRDKVKEKIFKTSQEAMVRMEAVLVLHRGDTTKTINRSMERHMSPKPILSFEKEIPPKLLGSLYSTSITHDLVPFLRKKMGDSP